MSEAAAVRPSPDVTLPAESDPAAPGTATVRQGRIRQADHRPSGSSRPFASSSAIQAGTPTSGMELLAAACQLTAHVRRGCDLLTTALALILPAKCENYAAIRLCDSRIGSVTASVSPTRSADIDRQPNLA